MSQISKGRSPDENYLTTTADRTTSFTGIENNSSRESDGNSTAQPGATGDAAFLHSKDGTGDRKTTKGEGVLTQQDKSKRETLSSSESMQNNSQTKKKSHDQSSNADTEAHNMPEDYEKDQGEPDTLSNDLSHTLPVRNVGEGSGADQHTASSGQPENVAVTDRQTVDSIAQVSSSIACKAGELKQDWSKDNSHAVMQEEPKREGASSDIEKCKQCEGTVHEMQYNSKTDSNINTEVRLDQHVEQAHSHQVKSFQASALGHKPNERQGRSSKPALPEDQHKMTESSEPVDELTAHIENMSLNDTNPPNKIIATNADIDDANTNQESVAGSESRSSVGDRQEDMSVGMNKKPSNSSKLLHNIPPGVNNEEQKFVQDVDSGSFNSSKDKQNDLAGPFSEPSKDNITQSNGNSIIYSQTQSMGHRGSTISRKCGQLSLTCDNGSAADRQEASGGINEPQNSTVSDHNQKINETQFGSSQALDKTATTLQENLSMTQAASEDLRFCKSDDNISSPGEENESPKQSINTLTQHSGQCQQPLNVPQEGARKERSLQQGSTNSESAERYRIGDGGLKTWQTREADISSSISQNAQQQQASKESGIYGPEERLSSKAEQLSPSEQHPSMTQGSGSGSYFPTVADMPNKAEIDGKSGQHESNKARSNRPMQSGEYASNDERKSGNKSLPTYAKQNLQQEQLLSADKLKAQQFSLDSAARTGTNKEMSNLKKGSQRNKIIADGSTLVSRAWLEYVGGAGEAALQYICNEYKVHPSLLQSGQLQLSGDFYVLRDVQSRLKEYTNLVEQLLGSEPSSGKPDSSARTSDIQLGIPGSFGTKRLDQDWLAHCGKAGKKKIKSLCGLYKIDLKVLEDSSLELHGNFEDLSKVHSKFQEYATTLQQYLGGRSVAEGNDHLRDGENHPNDMTNIHKGARSKTGPVQNINFTPNASPPVPPERGLKRQHRQTASLDKEDKRGEAACTGGNNNSVESENTGWVHVDNPSNNASRASKNESGTGIGQAVNYVIDTLFNSRDKLTAPVQSPVDPLDREFGSSHRSNHFSAESGDHVTGGRHSVDLTVDEDIYAVIQRPIHDEVSKLELRHFNLQPVNCSNHQLKIRYTCDSEETVRRIKKIFCRIAKKYSIERVPVSERLLKFINDDIADILSQFRRRNSLEHVSISSQNISKGYVSIVACNQTYLAEAKKFLLSCIEEHTRNLSQVDRRSSQSVDNGYQTPDSTNKDSQTYAETARNQSSMSRYGTRSGTVRYRMITVEGNRINFITKQNVSIFVLRDNIIDPKSIVNVEVVASPCDEKMSFGGGLSEAIKNKAGSRVVKECHEYYLKHGPIKVTGYYCSEAGELTWSYSYLMHIMHVVGPDPKSSKYSDSELVKLTSDTYVNCLIYANNKLKKTSIALPPLGAGTYQVRVPLIVRAAIDALQRVDKYFAEHVDVTQHLRQIYFVSIDSKLITEMVSEFRKYCE